MVDTHQRTNPPPASDPRPEATSLDVNDAILTYRYLRISMVAVLLMLAVSVLIVGFGEDCWLSSVSAYYYTPVRNVFVGALVVFGAALVAYHGSTPEEEALLNLSGCMSLVVALVPTGYAKCEPAKAADLLNSGIDAAGPAAPVPAVVVDGVRAAVTNNVWSLIAAAIAAVLLGVVVTRAPRPVPPRPRPADRQSKRGPFEGVWKLWVTFSDALAEWWPTHGRRPLILSCIAIPVLGLVWFLFWRDSFVGSAHLVAAIVLVVGLILYMVCNATLNTHSMKYSRLYQGLAAVLLLVLVGIASVILAAGLNQAIFYLEFAVLGIFVIYWIVQSFELRGQKVQKAPSATG